eukprot:CAMPEP_0185775956 /NCGR_PEP_ID=MMETSP1174-20130828/83882_1 /TAXON_ID=35687 /ORGANISM="Dictyocha speculum, Strain CCMP1381" /LENGTH=479 /DNA_ID=CAMNT_0028463699 /DNA_START=123 /DNA_END=1562 /DNA_ORIENTATION=+
MYSGFVNLTSSDVNRRIHYTFVESEGSPAEDPVVLWVQGGPGGSSLEGMWTENMGPFQLSQASLATSPPTPYRSAAPWTSVANMLFWEAPGGVGFSHCTDENEELAPCPAWNDTTSAVDAAAFICSFFSEPYYPEMRGNPFFITGESYAGVYIPTTFLALEALDFCAATGSPVRIEGIAIGNGCTGTENGPCDAGRSWNTYTELAEHGFISQPTHSAVLSDCADSARFTHASPACQAAVLTASDEAGPFNNYNIHDTCGDPGSTLASFICGETSPTPEWACSHRESHTPLATQRGGGGNGGVHYEGPRGRLYGYDGASVSVDEPENYHCGGTDAMEAYLSDPEVQAALHVEAAQVESWPGEGISYTRSAADLLTSSGYPDLVESATRVLIYSGDFDGQIPHSGTEEWTRGMGYPIKEHWRPWSINGSKQVAGHVVTYDVADKGKAFAFMTVAGAGHMVPTFKANESLTMISRFINDLPF